MGSQLLLLNWDNHKANVISEFQQLFLHSELTDVTLACNGFSLQAHKTVLSASSSFFRSMFLHHPCKHAYVILTDVDCEGLKAIVDFMYHGQVHISQEKLTQFLTVAEKLKIKGLSTVTQNESYRSLEELMTNIDKNGESLNCIDRTSGTQENTSSVLYQENRSQQAELSISSRNEFTSSTSSKTSCNSSPTLNTNCRGELFKCISVSSETHNEHKSTIMSRNQPAVLCVNLEETASSSSTNCKTVKVEPSDEAPSICREESLTRVDILGQEPDILYSDTLVETIVSHQPELRFGPREKPSNPLANYETLENEQCDRASSSVHEDNSFCELEAEFSSSSVHSVPSSSTTSILQNQPFLTPSHSSKETAQCLFQMHSTNKIHSSPTPIGQEKNAATTVTTSKLRETKNSACLNKIISNQTHTSKTSTDTRTKLYHDMVISGSFSRCIICKKKFSSWALLIAHQRSHFEEGHLCCGICNKMFKRKQSLKTHMMTHSGEQPYSCGFCGKKFSRKGNMLIHRRIHTGEKPYSCHYCEKRFSDKTSLIYHLRKHHQEKLLSCNMCKKSFINSCTLKIHLCGHFTNESEPKQTAL